MAKIIAVVGATGVQGGSVIRIFQQQPDQWHIRALTRDASKPAARELAVAGVEVVEANLDDPASLQRAFEGVHAIFAMTMFDVQPNQTANQCAAVEEARGVRLAEAAAGVSTLEHYIWHSLPPAARITNGRVQVPHFDCKARVDDYIKERLHSLAAITTYLYIGLYAQNFAWIAAYKPINIPASGNYAWLQPCEADTRIPTAGDVTVNIGIFVRQILANPEVSLGRYANVRTRLCLWADMLAVWTKVTGKGAVYVQVEPQAFEDLWGLAGFEIARMMKFLEETSDYEKGLWGKLFVTAEELQIDPHELRDDVAALMPLADQLL